jgi:hypothetical protein
MWDLFVGQIHVDDEYTVERIFLKFDTTTIPSGATITSAYLSLFAWHEGTGWSMVLQKWIGDTPIDMDDYNQFDEIDYGSEEMSSWIDYSWNNITITDSGLIQKAEYTKICLRSSDDISSTPPTTEYEFACVWGWYSHPAKLVVTYYTGEEVEGSKAYPYGSTVNLIAVPTDDFLYWLLDNETVYDNPITVTMDSDHDLKACFEPVCAMKTLTDGDFYVPTVASDLLKIELLFDDSGIEGDQTGNSSSPYETISDYPDGIVELKDFFLLSDAFGAKEGDPHWNYMADVNADGIVELADYFILSAHYGNTGTYITDFSGVTVTFDTGEVLEPENGYVTIPSGAASFTVKQNGNPIGAMIIFW